ncbi:hypothetical protein WAF17_13980 [Bernardetia sp. ABR2-2B]|uniref:hypothetical protein n=1 Tax=Bernardetia sp. ABR2-2B TaxID=3127472 RepID=UPI0030D24BF7
MIPIQHRDLEKLAQRHWEAIKNYAEKGTKKFDLKYFDDAIKKYFEGITFEQIVLASPSEIDDLVEIWNAHQCKDKEDFQGFLTYYGYLTNGFVRKKENDEETKYSSKDIVESLNISVCPYCNRNYIKLVETERKVKEEIEVTKEEKVKIRIDELDHFYPKKKYPFLAVSFYNLIPSCKTCNQTFKGTKLVSVNPYSKIEEFSFGLKIENSKFYYDKDGFCIDYERAREVLKENYKVFHIKELYDQHKDQVLELIQKQITYPDSYIDELFKKYEGTFFRNKEDVIRHLSNGIMEEENFHLRPLSKLTHDIAQELGLLD